MKITSACIVCGKRAKQWPINHKVIMCMMHYNKYIQGKIDKDGKPINKQNGKD